MVEPIVVLERVNFSALVTTPVSKTEQYFEECVRTTADRFVQAPVRKL